MSVSLIDGHIDDDALEMTVESVIENLEKVRCHITSEWDKFIIDDVCAFMKRQKAEIERQREHIELLDIEHEAIRISTIKEFADRMKGMLYRDYEGEYVVCENDIDSLVKEMVGE